MDQYYLTLQVDKFSSQEEIKTSYRTLAKQYHPDTNPTGTAMFLKIKEAYDWLVKNHKQQKLKKSYNKNQLNFYRILDDNVKEQTIEIPIDYVDGTVTIFLMYKGKEARLIIRDKTLLPCSWDLPDYKIKLRIKYGNH